MANLPVVQVPRCQANEQDKAKTEEIRRKRAAHADLIGGISVETSQEQMGGLTQSQSASGGLTVEEEVMLSFESSEQQFNVEVTVPQSRS